MSDDRGFTLVEQLVTMVLAVVVLMATMSVFDSFTSGSAANDRLTQAEDGARMQLDQVSRLLRNATPAGASSDAILYPPSGTSTTNDLVFTTYDWPFPGGTANRLHALRVCVDGSRNLWIEGLDDAAAYTGTALACPSSWTHGRLVTRTVANSASDPLFRLDATRRAIAITLTVDGGTASRVRTIPLRSSAYLRGYAGKTPTVAASDIATTCDPTAKTALLTLGSTIANDLNVVYLNAAGQTLGSGAVVTVAAAAASTITIRVSNVLGLVQTLTKTVPAC